MNSLLVTSVYRAPDTDAALETTCHIVPNGPIVLDGNFNATVAAYQPGRTDARELGSTDSEGIDPGYKLCRKRQRAHPAKRGLASYIILQIS